MSSLRRTQLIPSADIEAMLSRVYPELTPAPDTRATRDERIQDFVDAGRIRSADLAQTQPLIALED